jgi:hypothetical protein
VVTKSASWWNREKATCSVAQWVRISRLLCGLTAGSLRDRDLHETRYLQYIRDLLLDRLPSFLQTSRWPVPDDITPRRCSTCGKMHFFFQVVPYVMVRRCRPASPMRSTVVPGVELQYRQPKDRRTQKGPLGPPRNKQQSPRRERQHDTAKKSSHSHMIYFLPDRPSQQVSEIAKGRLNPRLYC